MNIEMKYFPSDAELQYNGQERQLPIQVMMTLRF